MSSAEIKLDIIRLIDGVEDSEKLHQAYIRLLSFLEDHETNVKNPKLEESLRISLQQIAEGKVLTNDEVMRKYSKRFGK